MADVRGFRIGLPIIGTALACSLVAVLIGTGSQARSGMLPRCIGRDEFGDGFNFIDLFFSCSDGYRLSLMALLSSMAMAFVSGFAYMVADNRFSIGSTSPRGAQILSAGVSVGLLYLFSLYVHEYLFHHGYTGWHRLHPAFIVAAPILVSLMHFPNRWGLVLAAPIFAAGFASLIFIAWMTGIPLD